MKTRYYWTIFIALYIVANLNWSVHAKVYQYRDKNGILNFTDDPTDIPLDQLTPIKSYPTKKQKESPPKRPRPVSKIQHNTWDAQIKSESRRLNQMQAELALIYRRLENNKKKLNIKSTQIRSSKENNTHINETKMLNRQIKSYHQKLKQYKKALADFNKKLHGN